MADDKLEVIVLMFVLQMEQVFLMFLVANETNPTSSGNEHSLWEPNLKYRSNGLNKT